jgi:hypothetical protein
MSMSALRQLCVNGFPLSQTRAPIMAGMEAAISKLVSGGIAGDLWVDGSFLTMKIDPEDVDMTLRLTAAFVNGCTNEQTILINWFNSGEHLKNPYFCHSHAWVDYPPGHPLYWNSEWDRAYWIRQWGFSRRSERKGIAVVSLPQGAV